MAERIAARGVMPHWVQSHKYDHRSCTAPEFARIQIVAVALERGTAVNNRLGHFLEIRRRDAGPLSDLEKRRDVKEAEKVQGSPLYEGYVLLRGRGTTSPVNSSFRIDR